MLQAINLPTADQAAPTAPAPRLPIRSFAVTPPTTTLAPPRVPPGVSPPVVPSCAPFMMTTSAGCIFPPNTIATFSPSRGRWRVAVTLEFLKGQEPVVSPVPPIPTETLPARTGFAPASFGRVFGQTATHQAVAESDQPPPGVTQVDEATFAVAVGETIAPSSLPPDSIEPTTAAPTTAPSTPFTPVTTTTPPSIVPSTTTVPTEPVTVTARQRLTGCIARFNKTRNIFSIYCPITSPSVGLGNQTFRCLRSSATLGATEVKPPPPEGFVKVAETATLPNEGEVAAGEETDVRKFFRLNNPYLWLAIAGTATVLGGGGYLWFRYRRKRSLSDDE